MTRISIKSEEIKRKEEKKLDNKRNRRLSYVCLLACVKNRLSIVEAMVGERARVA